MSPVSMALTLFAVQVVVVAAMRRAAAPHSPHSGLLHHRVAVELEQEFLHGVEAHRSHLQTPQCGMWWLPIDTAMFFGSQNTS